MAKSIRSKSKRKNRAIKRLEVFKPVEDKRLLNLSKAVIDKPTDQMNVESTPTTAPGKIRQ